MVIFMAFYFMQCLFHCLHKITFKFGALFISLDQYVSCAKTHDDVERDFDGGTLPRHRNEETVFRARVDCCEYILVWFWCSV